MPLQTPGAGLTSRLLFLMFPAAGGKKKLTVDTWHFENGETEKEFLTTV